MGRLRRTLPFIMTRRLTRTATQFVILLVIVLITVFFLDNQYRVLPPSIHNYLPSHYPDHVITDITVTTCSSLSVLSGCNLDPQKWHRIDKDIYLGNGWLRRGYVHVQRKKEDALTATDKVILDIRVGRLDPGVTEKGDVKWESREAGIWLKRSAKPHASDSLKAITAVDILFGADAVEPRPGWSIAQGTPLLLGGQPVEVKLTTRKGRPVKLDPVVPRIRKSGKFKIMQVADLHLSTGLGECRDAEPKGEKCDADPRTLDFIGKMLDHEKPDLVVLTGDQVNGETAPDAQTAVFKFAAPFIERKIPYAAIFGNHDDEGSLSRSALMTLIQTLPYSLSEPGPNDVDGVGNYVIEVLAHGGSHHSALSLYLLDTHSYSPDEHRFRGYDWLKNNQIDWFTKTAEGLKSSHAAYTHIHMDMAFIHIPLPEYRDQNNEIVGAWREPPTAPGFNSGFRDALVKQGILIVSCGHDHANEYCMLSKTPSPESKPALWMCYGGGVGFGGYGGYGGYHRRVRFFEIDTNEARISTYKRVEWAGTEQEMERRIDERIVVEGGRVVAR
ncbi:hypothetical protein FGG08_004756 [Glutinoglossum americanum]|uniref:Calcineurin-like phosphoesterase domain-containing protein n=1 Tax=Glutinoglossum americanum TaxID=1670608 RepID=A0A9P8L266_9PEZI|nr:hypothetical protein FGG08_004756 [Glutinoglossum americanum]